MFLRKPSVPKSVVAQVVYKKCPLGELALRLRQNKRDALSKSLPKPKEDTRVANQYVQCFDYGDALQIHSSGMQTRSKTATGRRGSNSGVKETNAVPTYVRTFFFH